jgi:tetratricopeptide (TPR) repeat protein
VAEQERTLKEAEFALKQAFAFCPYSPEAVYRYTSLLATPQLQDDPKVRAQRLEDAERVVETCLRFDRENLSMQQLLNQVRTMRQAGGAGPVPPRPQQRVIELEIQHQANPSNGPLAFELASLYLHLRRTNEAFAVFDRLTGQPGVDANALLSVAQVYAQLGQGPRLEATLLALTTTTPESPEAWYDLASTQAILGKSKEALDHLQRAVELSQQRRATTTTAPDLRITASASPAFASLKALPEFQALVATN